MMQEYFIGLEQRIAVSIDMMRFRSAPIVFEYVEIFSFFEVFDGSAFYIVPAIIKMPGVVAKAVENL